MHPANLQVVHVLLYLELMGKGLGRLFQRPPSHAILLGPLRLLSVEL